MKKSLSPYLIIILSFLVLIVFGTILLLLPFATNNGFSLKIDDALFLSTSSVTITGMSTIDNLNSVLSPFGKIVVTLLVKVGGLSVITLSVFIMFIIGAKIGISNRILIKENLNQLTLKGVVKLVKWIFFISIIIELVGALINFIVFIQIYSFGKALAVSLIQSIISFNNAGFDLMGVNNLLINNSYPLFTLNTLVLIILGGIGFIVLADLFKIKSYKNLSIHTKIVLKVNLFLWTFGFLMFKIGSNLTVFQALFLSVNARSAGFAVNLGMLPNQGILILMFLMLIGASPTSTGSGIKTTTLFVLYKSVTSFAVGKETTTNKRLISREVKYKAFILLITIIIIIFVASTILLMLENIDLQTSLHEVVASVSNAGLSSGYSYYYSFGSKVLVMLLMLIGRVGVLTIIAVFNPNWYKPVKNNITYIEEKIIIG